MQDQGSQKIAIEYADYKLDSFCSLKLFAYHFSVFFDIMSAIQSHTKALKRPKIQIHHFIFRKPNSLIPANI